jgi:hypothetical protein
MVVRVVRFYLDPRPDPAQPSPACSLAPLVSRAATSSPFLPLLSHLLALGDPVDRYRRILDPKVSSFPLSLSLSLPPLSLSLHGLPASPRVRGPLVPRPHARPPVPLARGPLVPRPSHTASPTPWRRGLLAPWCGLPAPSRVAP